MSILIVDDRPTNLKLLRFVLESEGYQVCEARDGIEALALLEREPVRAIISDVLMPNMDGFRLCLEVRKHARFHAVPFVVYTSTYSSSGDRQLAYNAGADCYLIKPAPATVILETLADAFAKAAERKGGPAPTEANVDVIKQYNAALVSKLEERNAELEGANAKLMASEERFRSTLERMLEGCQILDRDWRYIYVNEAAARHGRRTRGELVGRTMFESYPGFESGEAFGTLRRCMDERTTARVETEFTYADGSKAWFELSVQPVPEGLFILSLDVTERSKSGQKIRAQLDELQRWQGVMLNREDRVHALKLEVNALLAELHQPPRYGSPIKS
jgi:PAS domain S-box-containing protein